MQTGEKTLRISQLGWRDKSIHRTMANAHTQMVKVAAGLREHKAGNPDWMQHASEIAGAAEILAGWMHGLRVEAENEKQEGCGDGKR